MNCVIYARYSSSNQNETSIDAQVRACTEHAERKGYTVVHIFPDYALTATNDNRPAFQEMIAAARTGAFDIVLVHKFDRFARDTLTHDLAKNELLINSVRLESVLEPLDDSPESVISESVYKGMAEYYSRNLSREIKKGRREVREAIKTKGKGRLITGKPRFGYDVNSEKEFVINEAEAKVIRLIFELYLEGNGYLAIVNELDKRGYTTRTGMKFNVGVVREALTYEQYSGVFITKYNPSNTLFKKNRRLAEKQCEAMRIEDGIPAIISKETFAAVHKRIKNNISAGRQHRAKEPYILSGLVICGHCGRRMGGSTNGRGLPYYACNTYKRGGECEMKMIIRNDLEELLLDFVERSFSAEVVESLIRVLDRRKADTQAKAQDNRQELARALASVGKRIDAVINEMVEVASSPALRAKLVQLEAEKAHIEAELLKCNKEPANPLALTAEQIRQYVGEMADIRNKPRAQQQRLMQSIIHSVKVTDATLEEIAQATDTEYIHDKKKAHRIVKVEIFSSLGQRLQDMEGVTSFTPTIAPTATIRHPLLTSVIFFQREYSTPRRREQWKK